LSIWRHHFCDARSLRSTLAFLNRNHGLATLRALEGNHEAKIATIRSEFVSNYERDENLQRTAHRLRWAVQKVDEKVMNLKKLVSTCGFDRKTWMQKSCTTICCTTNPLRIRNKRKQILTASPRKQREQLCRFIKALKQDSKRACPG